MDIGPLIELRDIVFGYPSRKRVLDGLSFQLRRGEKVGIIGPNGSGKTTMLLIAVGLLKPDSGEVRIFGKVRSSERDFREVRRRIGFLFQNSDDQLFCPTVEEDIAFGPLNQGKSRDEVGRIVREVISLLGIEHLEGRFSHTLSEGEKRLVALATALAMRPEVLLLDEPTTALNEDTTRRIADFLRSSDLTYCVVSHDMRFLSDVTDKLYLIKEGKLLAGEG
jgi:cobalt/nickel transport system ATP-binding protein